MKPVKVILSSEAWRIIDLQYYNPYMNMAIDEAILDSVSKGKSDKTIRFYKWNPGAVSLGIAQDSNIVKGNVNIVRRPTGGNAVYHHEKDFTYSVIAPKNLFNNSLREAYKQICNCIINAINSFSLEAKLVGKNDILIENRKVCGNAIDFSKKDIFLQHGSIFFYDCKDLWLKLLDIEEEKLKITFLSNYIKDEEKFYNSLKKSFIGFSKDYYFGELTQEEKQLAETLAKEKYSNVNWHEGLKKGTACAADIRSD